MVSGKWIKNKKGKYMHYFDPNQVQSLCRVSKNKDVVTDDAPHCPVCQKFVRIRNNIIENQTFKFQNKEFRIQ
jgi:hypothetical protein